MGRRHLRVVADAGLDVIGVADQRAEALDAVAREEGIPRSALFSDVADLFSRVRPELVVVATTAPTHAEFTIRAAEAGAEHVLCEKPMAHSLAGCEAMTSACRSAGTLLAINHQMRFMDQYRIPKQMLDSEAFGGLESMTVVAGNFGLSMNGTHYVEAFRYLAEERAATASAWFEEERVANPRGPEFEDRSGSIRLETGSGRRFYLDASGRQGHGMTATYGARYGQITVDELAGRVSWTARQADYRDEPTTRYAMPWEAGQQAIEPADALGPTRLVLDALLSGDDFPSAEDGRHAVAALVAAYLSAERGGAPVPIDDALPANRTFPWA
jgi:predicted dehydrogenase